MRINLFGGPGTGKSLLASHLYEKLRREGYGIELVQEAIKPEAYRSEMPEPWFNVDFFTEQLRRERNWIHAGVPHLVSDSPLLLNCYYMLSHNYPEASGCLALCRAWNEARPALNLFLERSPEISYVAAGRYEDSKAADRVDTGMAEFLRREGVEVFRFAVSSRFEILDFLRERLHSSSAT